MLQCALTGGIGSGKSTVADAMQELGLAVLRADRLAAEVLAPQSEGLAILVEDFGPEILDAQGRLNRPAMAQRIFSDPAQKARVESIVHPRVAAMYQTRCNAFSEQGHRLVVYEIPLLLETGKSRDFDCVIVVTAPLQARIERVMQRSEMSAQQVKARMTHQVQDQARIRAADFVVHNDGDLTQLLAQVPPLCAEIGKRLDARTA